MAGAKTKRPCISFLCLWQLTGHTVANKECVPKVLNVVLPQIDRRATQSFRRLPSSHRVPRSLCARSDISVATSRNFDAHFSRSEQRHFLRDELLNSRRWTALSSRASTGIASTTCSLAVMGHQPKKFLVYLEQISPLPPAYPPERSSWTSL